MVLDLPTYAAGVLAGLPLTLLALALAGVQRSAALWSGGLLGTLGVCGELFSGHYWSPQRLLGGHWGVEDVLFNFQMGVIVWTAASLRWRQRLRTELRPLPLLTRGLALTLPMLAVLLIGVRSGLSPMTIVVSVACLALTLAATRPGWLGLAGWGAAGYSLTYLPALWLLFSLQPEMRSAWNVGRPWTEPLLAGLPAGEVAWATLAAAAHAVCFAWVAQVRIAAAPTGAP